MRQGEVQGHTGGRAAATAILWTVGAKGGRTGISILGGIVLARLVGPEPYGLFGMAMVVVGLLSTVNSLGFAVATVQLEGPTHSELSSAFWFQLLMSGAVTLIAVIMAGPASAFFSQPALEPVVAFLATSIAITALGQQHEALMRREMRFNELAAIEVVSIVLAVVSAIAVAWQGWGVWALVVQYLLTPSMTAVLVWWRLGWLPSAPRHGWDLRRYFAFSSPLFLLHVLESFGRFLDRALIGRFFGTREVGLYERSASLVALPMAQLAHPLTHVMLPSLSRAQKNESQFRYLFVHGFCILCWLTFPLAGFLAGAAEDVILLFLGAQWVDAADIFRNAAPGAALLPLMITRKWASVAFGNTKRMLFIGGATTIVLLFTIASLAPYGAQWVAAGRSVWVAAAVLVGLAFAVKGTPVSFWATLRSATFPALVGAAVSITLILSQNERSELPLVIRVGVEIGWAGLLSVIVFWCSGDAVKFKRFIAKDQVQPQTDRS